MTKAVVTNKSERKEREIELAWSRREAQFTPKVSKDEAWNRFEELRQKALGY